ncbi:hypothetical protein Lbir_2889 [Legionella birminghamensis]|uniref:Uncharacterized protein n=1 Tax=Legionella birminghamensis TaxID=28083 RepID=A0A378I8F1_9GAMM|nr:hypothetical protein Lbir_2889 [Legionella birminghamensis]STX31000.1 Uncharacterised protein [Legionella birminghamensis]
MNCLVYWGSELDSLGPAVAAAGIRNAKGRTGIRSAPGIRIGREHGDTNGVHREIREGRRNSNYLIKP